ncbi:hypothetical protein [Nocardia nova]|uniref:hypothetical protein n=1 Tax=Nocardia nova TaxID=37330 RepID=UPI002738F5BE|nr:hypothetical protein [Nocardia nova]
MSPAEYQARLDEVLRYLGALLVSPAGSEEWRVGRAFATMPDLFRASYIQSLIESGGRAREIGGDLLAIIQGYPEAVPA